MRLVSISAGVLTLGLLATSASAQIPNHPVYAAPGGTGVTVAGDFGRGVNDDAGKQNGFGGRIGVGLPMFRVWAGASTVKVPTGLTTTENKIGFGGGAAFSVLSGPAVPVNVAIQAGIGVLSSGGRTNMNIPAGVVLSLDVPSPTLDITPWVAPRVHITRTSGTGITSSSDVGFGASGGIDVTLPMGIGFHAALDWLTIGDPSSQPLTFGAGLHYRIAVPSLGGM